MEATLKAISGTCLVNESYKGNFYCKHKGKYTVTHVTKKGMCCRDSRYIREVGNYFSVSMR